MATKKDLVIVSQKDLGKLTKALVASTKTLHVALNAVGVIAGDMPQTINKTRAKKQKIDAPAQEVLQKAKLAAEKPPVAKAKTNGSFAPKMPGSAAHA